jgi:LacI family transcriptional regulator
MPVPPVSLRDLAKACGLSVSTISYALRNDSHVSVETRKLVAHKARELHYRPDGRLSELMAHLRNRRSHTNWETLAILHDGPAGREPWKDAPALEAFHGNVVKRAKELGYNTSPFHFDPAIIPPRRLTQILMARGIRGVIIAPPSRPGSLPLMIDTGHFSIAQCLHSIWEPDLPRVEPHHFENTLQALKNLHALGYRSAGLVIPETDARTTSHMIEGACDFAEKRHLMKFVRPFNSDYVSSPKLLLKWYREYSPDVVISYTPYITEWFQEAGVLVPKEVGICVIGATKRSASGIDFMSWQIDSTVVDLVVEQLHHNQLGVPQCPKVVLIRGRWQEGETLIQRPKAPSVKKRLSRSA